MVFTSLEFVIFFTVFYLLFIVTPQSYRLHLLLGASLFFFGYAVPKHLWLLLLTIAISYVCGIGIAADRGRRKIYLWGGIVSLLGLLAFFKYTDFAISLANSALSVVKPGATITPLGILLPIGISFFVFQAISYLVDVYRGDKAAEHNIIVLALFKAFFPQLVAGPIERSTNLLPQIRKVFVEPRSEPLVSREAMQVGSQLILLGFFKKVCIADNLALFADHVFAEPGKHGPLAATLGVYCFAFQIYCDFAGYSDIARGVSRIMGIDLMENFRRPYWSTSIREFWTRWHISLSSWFRDYLYKPLGGSQVGAHRWALNIMAVFLLSGLWHGAAVNFIIWGGVHGVIYLFENGLAKLRPRPLAATAGPGLRGAIAGQLGWLLAMFTTFHVVCFAWIFFRARTFGEAIGVLQSIASIGQVPLWKGFELFERMSFAWCVLFVAILLVIDAWAEWGGKLLASLAQNDTARWTMYYAAAAAIIVFGNWQSSQQFIYFQF
ncbi:MAG TPA: MBOAT family O-acyltransferase [Hyphomicrobiaceae bacterium]|nr:MBOAT family O-acyltransferase [Hyphomicrobiaceae bacterium]